jgi:hypothetical protein
LTSSPVVGQRAALPRFTLEWNAPEGCLDRDAARSAIETALGMHPSSGKTTTVVRVNIVETETGRFVADIWMYDATASGERTLEGGACDQVAQAAALSVAFALEAGHDVDSGKTPARPTKERPVVPIAAHAKGRPSLALGAWLMGDIGSLPQADAGLAVAIEARRGRLSAEVIGSAWLPRTAHPGPVAGIGGEFALYTGALRGCIDLLPVAIPTLRLGPCAGAELGMTTGSGVGLSAPNRQQELWAAGLFGFSLRYLGVWPFALGLLTELGVPIRRPTWQIDNFRTVFEPSLVIGRASLGVSWQFL